MSVIKLRLLLHLARKRPGALLIQVAKGAFCMGAIPFFITATVYNTTHDVAFHSFGANLAFGVFFAGLFCLVDIFMVLEWRENLEELTIPYAHQDNARPYGYFMHALPKSIQPTLF